MYRCSKQKWSGRARSSDFLHLVWGERAKQAIIHYVRMKCGKFSSWQEALQGFLLLPKWKHRETHSLLVDVAYLLPWEQYL